MILPFEHSLFESNGTIHVPLFKIMRKNPWLINTELEKVRESNLIMWIKG